eukprot:gnl/MRDRNA2_/MRDRNA2_16755_c0_seq1.p1 gnl/MRDRNA2_/MRDRNA2_16755_c0~~gnl/MRDRNA2_/MRDRNA2_16755_c0_seq1.p1  ORF type:complete len:120 (-),score=3.57 gnl/MRDRNA2_/MRDRNA2_16755_c0_seq1:97-456(-)
MRFLAIDIDLGHQMKLIIGQVILRDELLDLSICSRLLLSELITRESNYMNTIIFNQLLEILIIVFRISSFTCNIRYDDPLGPTECLKAEIISINVLGCQLIEFLCLRFTRCIFPFFSIN